MELSVKQKIRQLNDFDAEALSPRSPRVNVMMEENGKGMRATKVPSRSDLLAGMFY